MNHLSASLCLLLSITLTAPAAVADVLDASLRTVVNSDRPLEMAKERGFAVLDGRIQVVALSAGSDTTAIESWLEANGAQFVLSARGRVQAFVPVRLLEDLENHPGVVYVERPIYARVPEPAPVAASKDLKTLAVTSEAVEVMNAPAWNASGVTGEGVRVAIIDAEFGGWEDLLGVELPPADRTTYRAFGGSTVVADQTHGTACAEIVYDIAPGAEMILVHIRTNNDFLAALVWLSLQDVDVVTMSVGWFGTGPGDGTGRMADAISAFITATDVLFFTSAGNERQSHWQGQTLDGEGDDWVDFSPGDGLNELSSTFGEGERVAVNIVWNDWNSPSSDYSLHLFNLDGVDPVEVAVSDRPQSGLVFQTPYESIDYTAPEGGRFGVQINRAGVIGANDMELFSPVSDLQNRVAEGSLSIPADSSDVVAVAAVSYSGSFGVRGFSSAGPANGPGGSLTGGATKPDLSGYDGVSTVSYGPRSFYGTSAASPHTGGAAVLVRQAEPGMNHTQVREFLELRALDLGPVGKDNDYGWGRVFLGQTPGSTCSFSIDPVGKDVASSGGGGIIQLTTDSGCPWTTSSRVDWIDVAPPTGSGPRAVGFTVDANPGQARVGEVVIADQIFLVSQAGVAVETSTMVAGVAETAGASQTRWKSDLAILNPGDSDASVELRYRHSSGTALSSLVVGPGAIVELVNVAADTFGAADSAGAVEVFSTTPVIVTARTYNDAPEGTFGQFIPGVIETQGLAAGDVATLSQLSSNSSVRTNIGFVDLGGEGARVRILLFDGNGVPAGSELEEVVLPWKWFQLNRVFRAANAGDCEGCYAILDIVGDNGSVWAYASVVDNDSGDPTTIPMELIDEGNGGAAARYLVAGIAEVDGANQTKWKSNLALLNRSGQGVTANLLYRYGEESASSVLTLGDGELREFEDIVAGLFGSPGTAGAVDVDADGPLVVTARTFNDSPDGTFGQYLPGLGVAASLTTGPGGLLTQLKSTDDFRTNIGFTNYGDTACTVRTSLRDAAGDEKGVLFTSVPAGRWVQENRVFEKSGAGACPLGYAVVEVVTSGCEVWAYASVVDNGSGDPTTVPVVAIQ